jgi:hypothetical protein
MKNVTISLPEEIWESLRERASENQKSLNKYVGEILEGIAGSDLKDWQRSREELYAKFGGRKSTGKLSREEIYSERLI